ncbi:MAG: DNA gyrase inhibitor YacG [Alphaproteobacteria bacterium]|nr:DNA gyrase inhibitor YacG [Alphaproteobacteria bacterium]
MSSDPVVPLLNRPRCCPICGRPARAAHLPFCSVRCAQIDLGRWLNGAYRVETEEPAENDPGIPAG